jgi:hypothetical protein
MDKAADNDFLDIIIKAAGGPARGRPTKNRTPFLDLYKIHIMRNALRFFMTSAQEFRRPRATGAGQNGW